MSVLGVSVFVTAAEGGVLAIMRSTIPCMRGSNASEFAALGRHGPHPTWILPPLPIR